MYGEHVNQGGPEKRIGPPTQEEQLDAEAHFVLRHSTERPQEPDETPGHIALQQSVEYAAEVAAELERLQQEKADSREE